MGSMSLSNTKNKDVLFLNPFPTSTTVENVHYIPSQKTLFIEFKNGSLYSYEGVPLKLWIHLSEAKSLGSFIAKNVNNKFIHNLLRKKSK